MRSSPLILGMFAALAACDSSSSRKNNDAGPSPTATLPLDETDSLSASEGPLPPQLDTELRLPRDLSTDSTRFLSDLGTQLALRAEAFRQASESLESAGLTYCEGFEPARLDELKDRWRDSMGIWQSFEVFQVGPLADEAKTLKYSIYAWPDPPSLCKIDEMALAFSQNSSRPLPPNFNRKGLQAVEYLVFEPTLASHCDAGAATAVAWNAQTLEQKKASRCAYLKPLLADIRSNATTLATAWNDPNGNPLLVGTHQLQSLYNQLFYLDLEFKNRKLAAPAGHDTTYCPLSPQPCSDRQEFIFADFSREAIDTNVQALIDLLFGPDIDGRQGGLSGLVRAAGRDDVADHSEQISEKILQLSLSEKDSSLSSLIEEQAGEKCEASRVSWLCQMRGLIKELASDFKQEYASILKLNVPAGPQGDND